MKRSPMKRRGKKTTQWDSCRARLKKEFAAKGIVRCEICGIDNYLSFSHRLKRRFITDEIELSTVALLCTRHHDEIERKPHAEMYRIISEIIEKRDQNYGSN